MGKGQGRNMLGLNIGLLPAPRLTTVEEAITGATVGGKTQI